MEQSGDRCSYPGLWNAAILCVSSQNYAGSALRSSVAFCRYTGGSGAGVGRVEKTSSGVNVDEKNAPNAIERTGRRCGEHSSIRVVI